MPIATKVPGLRTPGEYPFMIVEISKDNSKAGNPMLTVLAKRVDGDEGLRSWFVAKNQKALAELAKLKLACGLPPQAKGEDLVGCKFIGKVTLDPPNAEGKQFSRLGEVRSWTPGFKAIVERQPGEETASADTGELPF